MSYEYPVIMHLQDIAKLVFQKSDNNKIFLNVYFAYLSHGLEIY